MPNRAQDWLAQARHDLDQARVSESVAHFDWACFAAQQGAEKGVKALHLFHGQEAWGHLVRRLLQELPDTIEIPAGLLDRARVLDAHYIPARYPNGHPEGAPADHYGALQAREAIDHADTIIGFCAHQMA
jgi:HEPN domain-containing protein